MTNENEGVASETDALAGDESLAWRIREAIKQKSVDGDSPDRGPESKNASISLEDVNRAAHAIGLEL